MYYDETPYDYGFDLPDERAVYHLIESDFQCQGCDGGSEDCSCEYETAKVVIHIRREYKFNPHDHECIDYVCYWDIQGLDGLGIQGLPNESIARTCAMDWIASSPKWNHDLETDQDAVRYGDYRSLREY